MVLINEKTLTKIVDLDTNVVIEEIYLLDGKKHRDPSEGPAHILRNAETGSVAWEFYYVNDKLHRADGPAEICYFFDGGIAEETWYDTGIIHRDSKAGPAHLERWRTDGVTVPVVTEYMHYGHHFRDPNKGPYLIERNMQGHIVEERFVEAPWLSGIKKSADAPQRNRVTKKPTKPAAQRL